MLISVPFSSESATLLEKSGFKKNDRVVVNQNTVKDPYYYLGTVTSVSKKDKMVNVFLDNGEKTKATVSNTGKGVVGHVSHKRTRKSVVPPDSISKHLDTNKWYANRLNISPIKPTSDSEESKPKPPSSGSKPKTPSSGSKPKPASEGRKPQKPAEENEENKEEETIEKINPPKNALELAKKAGPHSKELFDAINKSQHKFPDKKDPKWSFSAFGFWRPTIKDTKVKFPFPVAMKVRGYNKTEFVKRLEAKEKRMKPRMFGGHSRHRWTGEKNGAREYIDEKNKMRWPSGTITYLKQGVPPSRAFYKYMTGKDLPNLPY